VRPKLVKWVDPASLRRREIVIGSGSSADEPWEVFRFEGPTVTQVWDVIDRIDGAQSAEDIARASGQDLPEVIELVQRLFHAGVVEDVGGGDLPARAFYEHLRSTMKFAVLGWGGSPLMRRLWAGPVSRRLALGYLIETYHFAAAASSHQGAAVATMPTERLKTACSEHLSSEYWHSMWLRRGLIAAGMKESDFDTAFPLPPMLGQINHLRWLAVSDPLAYAVCIGVTERAESSIDVFTRFWDRFASHGVLEEAVYGPFREHDLLDCAENHESFGVEAFAERGPLNAAERARVRQRLLAYARLALDTHRQIVDWYGPAEGPLFYTVES